MIEDDRIAAVEKGVRVVSRKAWATLAAIGVLVACLVAWSFTGEIATKVAGNCIFMLTGGIVEVSVPATGRISELRVKPGDSVRAGQVIARLAQPDIEERLRRTNARVAELQTRASELGQLSRRGLKLNEEVLNQRTEFLREQIRLAESRVRIARDQASTARQLLTDGLVTHRAAEDADRELRAAGIAVRDLTRQYADLDRSRTDVVKRETDERAAAELELSDARRELAALEGEKSRMTSVVTPFAGRVIEVKASRGALISRDDPLVSIERADSGAQRLQVVLYVQASEGKKLLPGNEAQIVPATARREEYGYIRGRVAYVSDYPATPRTLIAALGSEELVRDLAAVAAPYEVRIDPPQGMERFPWSRNTSDHPDLRTGTLCRGEVVVRRERPVGFVIPALRREG